MSEIIHGDCLEVMQTLPDKSIDCIICDLPYGITACKWDVVIPFEPLWEQYKRIIKPNGAIALFGSQPFTSALVMSNPKWFKYDWVWNKRKATGHQLVKFQPLRLKEDILVFYKHQPTYNPQMTEGMSYKSKPRNKNLCGVYGIVGQYRNDSSGKRYPKNIIEFSFEHKPIHPTQKPVALFEYLIKTYTNEGDLVLDNCAGSGTLAIAALNTNRRYICIEKDDHYFEVMRNRIDEWHSENGYKLTLEERVQWLETQVQAQGSKIKKIEGDRQMSIFDVLP